MVIPFSDSTINLLVCTAGFSFGLAGLTGAYDIFRDISSSAEYKKIFHSVVAISGIMTTGSLLPLALSETEWSVLAGSVFVLVASSIVFVLLVWQLATKQVKLYFPRTSLVLFGGTAVVLCALFINCTRWNSITVLKLTLLWGLFISCYRFFLFIRHISEGRAA